jgi:xanthine dehydrogenase molybdopterin-binding subunit B
MRTTVTLDPDVERLLKAEMRAKGVSFKQALNDAVRAGKKAAGTRRATRFVQKTFSLGAEQNFRWEKALAVADAMEDEEVLRKHALRK